MFLIALLFVEGRQASVDEGKAITKKCTACCTVLTKAGCECDSGLTAGLHCRPENHPNMSLFFNDMRSGAIIFAPVIIIIPR